MQAISLKNQLEYTFGFIILGIVILDIYQIKLLLAKPNYQRCQHSLGGFQGEI